MRTVITLISALLAVCLLAACTQETEPPAKTEKPAVQTPQPATLPSSQMSDQANKELEKKVEEVKQESAAVAEEAEKAAAKVVASAEEAAKDIKQQARAVAPEVNAARPSAAPAAQPATPPELVSYAASMGTVTFNHGEHAALMDCNRCHPTEPPQQIVIDKEVAHNQLCKACHKESGGKAPTACAGCHKK